MHLNPEDDRYCCQIYVHLRDRSRYLLVCEKPPTRTFFNPAAHWCFIARGFYPPEDAKPWLKLNGYHQIWIND